MAETPPGPAPAGALTPPEAAAADLAALRTQVTPENVLLLHHGLKAEAQYLNSQLAQQGFPVHVGEPGKDLVSAPAAQAFNIKIDALAKDINSYIDTLNYIADQMALAAHTYGHTDEQIKQSFSKYYPDYAKNAAQMTGPGEPPAGPGGR